MAAFGGGQPEAQAAQLAQQYVKAEKEDQKKDIRKKLVDVLSQEFDHHSQQQQKELEELEKQIASLRAVLKKRVDAKATIVERRVEQLVQDAEGLGWNAPHTPRPGFSGGLGGARMMPPGTAPALNRPAPTPKLPESSR
jgi:hypothetical protein